MNKHTSVFFVNLLLAPPSVVHAAGAPVPAACAITPHPTVAKLLLMSKSREGTHPMNPFISFLNIREEHNVVEARRAVK